MTSRPPSRRPRPRLAATYLPVTVLLTAALAGCAAEEAPAQVRTYREMGFDGTTWPDLHGATVTILDHGAFDYVFGPAKERFEALTNGTLEHIAAADAGDALNRAILERDDPSFDVVYGIDNVLLPRALEGRALRSYTPLLADRVNGSYVFFDHELWPATPADHGYVAVNVDTRFGQATTLDDVRANADAFVTQDPRTSSPGLGFLLATVATYQEGSAYDWRDYWRDLFRGGVTVTSDWTTAYEQHFTGAYGGNDAGTKWLVTSYTTSPAYERFYESELENGLVLAPKAAFHQVETVAIARNTPRLAAAQAFVEFVLTDDFQDLHAEHNAVYPVVDGIDVARVYGGHDPTPGTFQPAQPDQATMHANVERWVREWTDLYEAHRA